MTDLSRASLVGANFQNANARGIIADDANFTGSNLRGAQFDGSSFKYAILDKTVINDASSFQGVNMEGASIKGMTHENADGSRSPVTFQMLQEQYGAQGLGQAVALEKAAAQGHRISTDEPVKAPSFTLPSLPGVSGAMIASAANLGNIPPQADLPNPKAGAAALDPDSPTKGMA